MVTTEQLKKLREITGISLGQCKKALEESSGDLEKSLIYLKKRGIEVAAKKADRELKAGIVQAYIHGNGAIGSLVELNCETDFVAKNDEFKALAYDIAMQVAATSPLYISDERIDQNTRLEVKNMFEGEVASMDKPTEIKEKILDGKIKTYLALRTLTSQPFIKNPDETIDDLLKNRIQKFGERIEVGRITRFAILER